MPETPFVKATFSVRGGDGEPVAVHFNPQSLQYAITNTLRNTGSGNSSKQYVSESTGKLSMELVFDTTDSGEDVRLHTVRVAELMEPGESDKTPPVVEFEWGLYSFAGMIESYKETLDFFSADGIPLRAAVALTLSSQDQVFEGGSAERRADTAGSLAGGGVSAPAPGAGGRGVTDVATRGGAPGAARGLAAANGLESMRFPGTAALELGAGVRVGAAASIGVGVGVGAGAGGAFAGLRAAGGASAGGRINVGNFLRPSAGASLRTDDAAAFSLGGQVQAVGSASYKADVGSAGALKARIEFDGDS